MNESELTVFVYGTLRSGSQDYYDAKGSEADAHRRYLRDADFLSPAKIQAELYMVDYYPGICLSLEDEWVVGELYLLRDFSQLHQLDVYEGCSAHSPKPHEYKREFAQVVLPNGEQNNAWAYIYMGDVASKEKVLSGDFLRR